MREINQDIGILTAKPIFLESGILIRLFRLLCDLTGSLKFKMVTTKPEVAVSQLVDKLATKIQRQ